MTCIAALIDADGKGHIASDSLGSNGHTKSLNKNRKIFTKEGMLIGYTSSYRMGQLLEYSLCLPQRKVSQDIESYMYVDFINAVRNLFTDNGFTKVDYSVEFGGNFVVITEGHLFEVQRDFSLLETQEPFTACGSGEDYAIAALDVLHKRGRLTPKNMLTEAIETAAKYVTSVGGEVRYLCGE